MTQKNGPLRIGIGGPVGSGKTTLTEKLCKAMRDKYSVAVITNDIYTQEDALILARSQALPEERIMGVETGGCPHTAIREDASINLQAIAEMNRRIPDLDIVFIESGGDNLAATFSPDLADLTLYVISVCQGEEIPRKGGPGITRSDFLVINKSDLAPHVHVDLEVMQGMRRGCAAHVRSVSPISIAARACRRLSTSSSRMAGWSCVERSSLRDHVFQSGRCFSVLLCRRGPEHARPALAAPTPDCA